MQGAWVDSHKICSIGLSFRHWVSRHGMSINVCTPKGRVEGLEGCGMEAGVHTSLQSLGLAFFGLSLGVVFNNKPIQGSCGGVGADESCTICSGDPQKCEELEAT